MEYIFSLEFIYLIASITYILGLKMLGKPETARKGNLIAAAGMTLGHIWNHFLISRRSTNLYLCINWNCHYYWNHYWLDDSQKSGNDQNARISIPI